MLTGIIEDFVRFDRLSTSHRQELRSYKPEKASLPLEFQAYEVVSRYNTSKRSTNFSLAPMSPRSSLCISCADIFFHRLAPKGRVIYSQGQRPWITDIERIKP